MNIRRCNRSYRKRDNKHTDAPVVVMRLDGKAYAVLVLPNDYPVFLLKDYIAKVPKAAPMERAG